MAGDSSLARELHGAELLLVDGDAKVQRGLEALLGSSGLPVTTAAEPAKALELLKAKVFGVVVIDLDTPSPGAGIELVRQVRAASPSSLVFLLAARKSFDGAVAAFRAGAHDVILKAPEQVDYLRARIVDAAGDWVTRSAGPALLRELRESYDEIIRRLMEAERRATDAEEQLSGRDARVHDEDEVRILFVDSDDRLFKAVHRAPGFVFSLAQTGGEALDQGTKQGYHIVLVGPSLPDLPSSLVLKTLTAQAPDTIVIAYEPNGRLDVVENSKLIPLVEKFTAAAQLGDRLAELADAHRAKARERRHLQVFRERQYDLLRKLADLRKRIDRALEDSTDTFTFTR